MEFLKIVKILKKECPPAFPVHVRRIRMVDDGHCTRKGNSFYIKVNKALSESQMIDTLLHEWAHALAWNHLHDVTDHKSFQLKVHDAAWGVAYSEVYRTMLAHMDD